VGGCNSWRFEGISGAIMGWFQGCLSAGLEIEFKAFHG